MKLAEMTKEDLDLLSYGDLTSLILKESKKALNTPSIFKKICELLEYSDQEYSDKIGEFYTFLTTDKRFIFLDKTAEWDLRDNHSVKLIIDEDDEEIEEELEIEDEEIEEEVIEDDENVDVAVDDEDLEDDDEVDEDLEELSIVDEDELDE